MRHPRVLVIDPRCTADHIGEIPLFLDWDDPRPAAEQLDAHYGHGGGWRPQDQFTNNGLILHYPGDPPFYPLAVMQLRDEMIAVYPYAYVAIFQPDESFAVCRMD